MPTEDTQSKATHFLSSTPLSWLMTHLNFFFFNYLVNSFISSSLFVFAFYLSLQFTLPVSLSAGYFSSKSQSSCDWSTHLFYIRVPEEQTIVLTTPIKLMMVIKNHTSIICAADISNGKQVILNGSHFPTLPSLTQTQIKNEHTLQRK